MIDIESWGTDPGSVILSIGAVMFDKETGITGDTFRVDIKPQSCIDAGLSISVDTILWWFKQDKEAIKDMLKCQDGISINEALIKLSDFIKTYAPDEVWGNGVRFDLGLLENAYHALGLKAPWPYWAERDVRTLVSFAPEIRNGFFNASPHTPVNDCIYQIKYCSAIWKHLNRNNSIT